MQLGEHKRTQARAPSGGTQTEAWDSASHGSKRSELWTGSTYLVSNEHDKQSAVAAVAKANDRNKNDAKEQARAQSFYGANQLSNNKGRMYRKAKEVVYDMNSFLQQAVDKYKSLVPQEFRDLKKVTTPFAEVKIARPTNVESEPQVCTCRKQGIDETFVCH